MNGYNKTKPIPVTYIVFANDLKMHGFRYTIENETVPMKRNTLLQMSFYVNYCQFQIPIIITWCFFFGSNAKHTRCECVFLYCWIHFGAHKRKTIQEYSKGQEKV